MNEAANPYAPPTAVVHDIDEMGATHPLKITSYKGRIGRLRYLAWLCGSYIVLGGVGAIAGIAQVALGTGGLVNAVTGIGTIVFLLFWAFWTIQRSHDMGWSGWTWLLTLIPLVVLVWIFKGGDKGPNRFGAPPPRNTFGVHFLAWLFPLLFVVGIVAAIAIPAYQGYAKRAQAAQTR